MYISLLNASISGQLSDIDPLLRSKSTSGSTQLSGPAFSDQENITTPSLEPAVELLDSGKESTQDFQRGAVLDILNPH